MDISAIIVFRNEEKFIGKALESIINQDLKIDNIEFILVDSNSKDNSLKIVIETFKKFSINKSSFKIINNPKQTLATGWNLGIKNANCNYVFRLDGHASISTNYFSEAIRTLENNKTIACVGGKFSTVNENQLTKIILSSKFGIGSSSFRTRKTSDYVDTIPYGVYRRDLFNQIGFFNEKLHRTQDIELHGRIKKNGYTFFLNDKINSYYYGENSFILLLKKAFINGYWIVKNYSLFKQRIIFRHVIPLAFTSFIIILLTLTIINIRFYYYLIIILSSHLLLGIYFSIKSKSSFLTKFIIPISFFLFHISYGFGSIIGLFSNLKYISKKF
jgi:glycosyltransferase involved in cell wall biosynthesis